MGCTSSSLRYREVYEELARQFQLPPDEMRQRDSSSESILRRSNCFALIGHDVDPANGQVRCVAGVDSPVLEDPKPVPASTLWGYAKKTWKLPTIHPLTTYLCDVALKAVHQEVAGYHEGNDRDDSLENVLTRPEYRLWLLAMCEPFHVLAVLQEEKKLPKAVKNWLKKQERGRRMQASGPSDTVTQIPEELTSVVLTRSNLSSKVVQRLVKEFPGAFPSSATTADDVLSIVETYTARANRKGTNPLQTKRATGNGVRFFDFVEATAVQQAFALRGKEEDASWYARPPAPPLEPAPEYPTESRAVVSSSNEGDEKEVEEDVEDPTTATPPCSPVRDVRVEEQPPLLPVEEAIEAPMACEPTNVTPAPSSCAQSDTGSTPVVPPAVEDLEKSEEEKEEEKDTLAEDDVVPEDEVVPEEEVMPEREEPPVEVEMQENEEAMSEEASGSAKEPVVEEEELVMQARGPFDVSALLGLGELLSRYDEIIGMLQAGAATSPATGDGGLSVVAREDLEWEKEAITTRLTTLFDLVRRGSPSLEQGPAAEGMRDAFNLQDVFAGATAPDHDTLSNLAFGESVEGAGAMESLEQFRYYLGLYINLYRMYAAARGSCGMCSNDEIGGVEPLSCDETDCALGALPILQQRQVALAADPYLESSIFSDAMGQEKSVSATASTPFRPLFDLLVQQGTHVGAGDSDRLPFDTLCSFVVRAIGHGDPSIELRALSELRKKLGLDAEREEGQKVSAAFVAKCCEAASCENTDFALAVNRKAHLSLFAPSSVRASSFTTLFAGAASSPLLSLTQSTWVDYMTQASRRTEDSESVDAFRECSSLFVHSLFASTVTHRCIWDARPRNPATSSIQAADASSATTAHLQGHNAVRKPSMPGANSSVVSSVAGASTASSQDTACLTGDTQITRKWFNEAARLVSAALGCPPDELLDNAGAILARRPAETIAHETSRLVKHNNIAPPASAMLDKKAVGEMDETAVLDRAFRELACVDHAAGMHGSTVLLEDFLYVCLFNYTKAKFGDTALFSTFFKTPIPFNSAQAIADLLSSLPLEAEEQQYRDFFLFSNGQRTVPYDFTCEANPELDAFCKAMYKEYETSMNGVAAGEEGFAHWFRDGVRCVKGEKGSLTARDYAGVLEYLTAHFVAFAKHRGSKEAAAITGGAKASGAAVGNAGADVAGEDVDAGHDAVRRRFVEELILFPKDEESSDAATRETTAETAKRVFTELQLNEMDSRNGDVSLNSAATWYGVHRATHVPVPRLSEMQKWLLVADRIPYTASTEHRRERRGIARDVRASAQQRAAEGVGHEGGTDPATTSNDGYMAADDLIFKCLSLYTEESIPTMPSCPDAASWLRSCIRCTNAIVGRTDLGERELHEQDLRFFFAFMHRDMTAYCTFQEAIKEACAVRALQKEGRLRSEGDEGTAAFMRAALERCLRGDLAAPEECIQELLRDDSVARFTVDEVLDHESLAHHVAAVLVGHAHGLFVKAKREHQEAVEARVLEIYEKEVLLGRAPHEALVHTSSDPKYKHSAMTGEPIATYWERLRHLLPHGLSLRHRTRRQQLWDRVDVRGKGYVTLADLNRGLHDVLRLNDFREDLAPVLFRAFFATTEMYAAESDVLYLTGNHEQFLLPHQFRVFLRYLYSYMELYFMFDVLTCSGFLNGKMQVRAEALDPSLAASPAVAPSSHTSAADCGTWVHADGTVATTAPGDALFEASLSPYAIMRESAGVRKEVTLSQFRAARRLLRHWGVHVEDTEAVFRDVNRRAREKGEMHFTGFAIWASEMGLHPEGYGYGFTEDADEVAQIEERLATVSPV